MGRSSRMAPAARGVLVAGFIVGIAAAACGAVGLPEDATHQADDSGAVQQIVEATGEHGDEDDDATFAREVSSLLINATVAGDASSGRNAQNSGDVESGDAGNGSSEDDVFVATDQWKEILPHQKIPKGLHVRMDLTTGKKEAKLLDNDAESSSTNAPLVGTAMALVSAGSIDEPQSYVARTVGEAFANRYPEAVTWLTQVVSGLAAAGEAGPKDGQGAPPRMRGCTEALSALTQLADWVDDIDQSRDLARAGGLAVVYMGLGDKACGRDVADASALVLGEASQNNPRVQEVAAADGVVQVLVSSLPPLVALAGSGDEAAARGAARTLYALGAVVRNSEAGQAVFGGSQGWSTLGGTLVDAVDAAKRTSSRASMGLVRKATTLVFDLAMEGDAGDFASRLATDGDGRNSNGHTQKAVDGICVALSDAVEHLEDADVAEAAVNCLLALYEPCTQSIPVETLRNALRRRYPEIANAPLVDGTHETIEFDNPQASAGALLRKLGPS